MELARCIQEDREPEPSGREGLGDVRIIEAIYRSAIERRPVQIPAPPQDEWPDASQLTRRPPIQEAPLVNVASPTGK
jgi:glucose-fructose oxidoreductase